MEKDENFTIRERIAIKLLLVLMNILKPTKWSHEWQAELKEVKELVDKA